MDRRTLLRSLAAASLLHVMTSNGHAAPVRVKKAIPSSGELLTPVGLGTWQTFDAPDTAAAQDPLREVLATLVEKGGSVVDSSPMYGRSEAVVGKLSAERALSEKLFIATKVWTSGEAEGIRQMERSFDLLKRKKLDLMQVHNLVDWKTHLQTLARWKEQGRVRYIGITHYTEGAYDLIERIMKDHPVDFLQINYSIRSRKAEERLFPLAQEKKIAVIINQPFEEGSLFTSVRNRQLPDWTQAFDCASWSQFFLKFIISHPAVTCVIPGTSKPHHMADNMGAAYGKLPDNNQRTEMIKLLAT